LYFRRQGGGGEKIEIEIIAQSADGLYSDCCLSWYVGTHIPRAMVSDGCFVGGDEEDGRTMGLLDEERSVK
jgi:hypothetical protein